MGVISTRVTYRCCAFNARARHVQDGPCSSTVEFRIKCCNTQCGTQRDLHRRRRARDALHDTCQIKNDALTQCGKRSATLATPASAQTSSPSPPGAPPMPSAPTISPFTLNATAPGKAITLCTVASCGANGLAFVNSKNPLDLSKPNSGP